MKIGIRNGSMGFPAMKQLFEQAAEIGFDGVELDIREQWQDEPVLSPEEREEIKRLSAESGVEVPSLCIGALWRFSPAASDSETLATARDLLAMSIEAAVDLGAQWILLPVTPSDEEISHEECQARWIHEMETVAPLAEAAEITLCLENVGRGCGKSAEDLLTLVTAIASPRVMTYYDIGNACAFGHDAVEEIRTLAEAIGVVHIKDREADLLGEGIVNIPGCVDALREISYDGWLILETPPTDDPLEAGNYNLAYLRDVVD
ncbi:MAG: sugar phosphate isomerase/epimerase [candidate division WS1 bacterium]|nr:sugar phosphate isomerase/epimerase [candidate division WS1 bacterium]